MYIFCANSLILCQHVFVKILRKLTPKNLTDYLPITFNFREVGPPTRFLKEKTHTGILEKISYKMNQKAISDLSDRRQRIVQNIIFPETYFLGKGSYKT